MSNQGNKATMDAFISYFMAKYTSMGEGVALEGVAYHKKYVITERKRTYRVQIGKRTTQLSSLYEVAKVIWVETFHPNKIYIPPPGKRDKEAIEAGRDTLEGYYQRKLQQAKLEMFRVEHKQEDQEWVQPILISNKLPSNIDKFLGRSTETLPTLKEASFKKSQVAPTKIKGYNY